MKRYHFAAPLIFALSNLAALTATAAEQNEGTHAAPSPVIVCGSTITTDLTLQSDLTCPDTTGYALRIVGNGITVNGNGHQITAPLSPAGLFVTGIGVTVTGFRVNGVTQGSGILAYDAPDVRIFGNDFSANEIGIELTAETSVMSGCDVFGNSAVGNSLFGIRTTQEGTGLIEFPQIRLNNFSRSGSYAIYISAADAEFDGSTLNMLYQSGDGLFLSGGHFLVRDLVLSLDQVKGTQIFSDQVSSLTLTNADVSTMAPANPDEERIGLELYRSGTFDVRGVLAMNNDIGIKLSNELGSAPEGTIANTILAANTVAGILVESYDGSPFGTIQLDDVCYRESTPAANVLVEPNTVATMNQSGGGCLRLNGL